MIKEVTRFAKTYDFAKAPSQDMIAGRLVKLDGNGNVAYVEASDTATDKNVVLGFLGQDVIATNVNTHILPSVKHFARYGEPVTVYIGRDDIFITDQTAEDVTEGAVLYVSAEEGKEGMLVKTNPGTNVPVAIALESASAGEEVKVKLL